MEHLCDTCKNRTTDVREYTRTGTTGTLYSYGNVAWVGCKASKRNPNMMREVPMADCVDYRPRKRAEKFGE